MANEITVSTRLRCSNGNFSYDRNSGSKSFNQTTARGGNPGTVNIGTSEETISFGDLTTPAWVMFENLDSTNYVTLGPDSTGMVAFMRLPPGGVALLYLEPSVTVKAQANTAACNVRIEALDA